MIDSHPELRLEEDGDISIDWVTDDEDFVSFSLRANGILMFAVLMNDGRKESGKAQITPLAFEVLRKLLPEEPG